MPTIDGIRGMLGGQQGFGGGQAGTGTGGGITTNSGPVPTGFDQNRQNADDAAQANTKAARGEFLTFQEFKALMGYAGQNYNPEVDKWLHDAYQQYSMQYAQARAAMMAGGRNG